MSLNHFSTDLQEPQWWSNPNSNSTHLHQDNPRSHFAPQFYQNHHPPTWPNPQEPTTLNFNLNHNHSAAAVESHDFPDQLPHLRHQSPPQAAQADEAEEEEEKERMFEKPLTPSDVGKLNRLVIPKQHAEKYFPLGGGDSGLLLSFEDESGKSWRFRYSYWNSSQSYVLTKGWSRYVKEKRLDAGDVVLFERRRAHTDRLFIGWRRRSSSSSNNITAGVAAAHDSGNSAAQVSSGAGESSNNGGGGGGGWTRMFYSAPQQQYSSYPAHLLYQQQVPYPPDCLHAAGSHGQSLSQTTTVGNSKILRLFGVNLECGQQQAGGADESEPSTPDGSSSLSMSSGHQQQQLFPRAYNYADHREDFSFSRDVNLMRNRRG